MNANSMKIAVRMGVFEFRAVPSYREDESRKFAFLGMELHLEAVRRRSLRIMTLT